LDFENTGLVVLLFFGIPNSPFAREGGYYNDKVMKKGPPGGSFTLTSDIYRSSEILVDEIR
jgi:hypothetical protein